MSTIRGSAHYPGLLPVQLPYEPSPVRPTTLENDRPPNRQSPVRKRASRALARFLIAFCVGVAATLACQLYGDAARKIIADLYPQLRWSAPQAEPAPDTVALVAPAFDRQLNAMSLNIDAVRHSLDRIAAGQEQIARSIDQIATSVAAGQEPTRTADKTATSTAQAPSTDASAIAVKSQADRASLQAAEPLEIKPTEVRPPHTLSERGKPLSATSGHDVSCFPSASAVLQKHPGVWPSWTLKAPGHEGTICWYASARPRARDHQSEMARRKEIVGTTETGLSEPPTPPYARAPE